MNYSLDTFRRHFEPKKLDQVGSGVQLRSGSGGGISARSHFRATSGPLNVQVEHITCRTIHWIHLEGFFSQKKLDQVGRGASGG